VTTTYDAAMQGKLPPRQTPETALRLALQGQIQDEVAGLKPSFALPETPAGGASK
jgi:hypothetical protein